MSDVVHTLRAIIREEISRYRHPEIAIVTSTYANEDGSGDNNLQINVKLRSSGVELQRVPVAVPCAGISVLPRVDDLVLVAFDGGEFNAPVVVGSLYGSKKHPPQAKPFEMVYAPPDDEDSSVRRLHIELPSGNLVTLDDDKITIQCAGTQMVINKDGDVAIQSNAKVTIQAQQDLELTAQGNLTLSAQQNVSIKGLSTTVEGQASATVKGPQVSLAGLTNFSPS